MKWLVLIGVWVVTGLSAAGQGNFGINLKGGVSKVFQKLHTTPLTTVNSETTYQFAPSGYAGVFYETNTFSAELLFVQLEGKSRNKKDLMDSLGIVNGYSQGEAFHHLSYLSLPIYYSYGISIGTVKIEVNIGCQLSFALKSVFEYKGENIINGQVDPYYYKDDQLYVEKFAFGLRGGLAYALSKKVAIEGTYYYALHNLFKQSIYTWKMHQIALGIKYRIGSSTTKKE